jgi:hypothetical protein
MDSIHSIVFPSDSLRSREIISRSNARSTGKYPSWKMRRMMHWESRNELNVFRLLDCDPNVWRFYEQPCSIEYTLGGVLSRHFPDVLVVGVAGKELWEIKTRQHSSAGDIRRRTEFLTQALPQHGYRYKLVVAEELAADGPLENAKLLLQFGRKQVTAQDWEQIRRAVKEGSTLRWLEICRGDYGIQAREIVSGLVLRGVLRLDMNSPITAMTRFHVANGGL